MKIRNVIPILAMLLIVIMAGCDKDDSNGVLPQVTSTVPENEAIDIDISTVISANFSLDMDPATINTSTFTLKQGTTSIPGTVTYSGTQAEFTPTNPLELNTEYTAMITSGAKDLKGNQLAGNLEWSFKTFTPGSGPEAVELNNAGNYVILAKTGISNSATSDIKGDLGLSPAATSYITGFTMTDFTGYAEATEVDGRVYAADMADPTPGNLTTAVENMVTAYNDASGRTSPHFLELGAGNIGGQTLVPGLYKWTTTLTLPTNVTISGGADDVWIFQIAQNLIVSSAVNVSLTGGAQAKNIFWQVAGTVTLGTTSHLEGIIISMTGITLQTGASLKGRALAQTAVVLNGNVVIQPE
ncbi:MAG: ice-binding family protein [Bacteroidales bacterium]